MANETQTFVIIDDQRTVKKNIFRRILSSAFYVSSSFALGFLADSDGMQWAILIVAIPLALLLWLRLTCEALTIEEAHEKLDKLAKD